MVILNTAYSEKCAHFRIGNSMIAAILSILSFGNCFGKTELTSRTSRMHTPSLKCEECVASAAEKQKIMHNIAITRNADKI